MKTKKSIAQYVIDGVFAENEQVARQRVAIMLERKGLLNKLVDGVPTVVSIVNEKALAEWIRDKQHENKVSIEEVGVTDDFDLYVRYRYLCRTYWCRDQKTAEKVSRGNTYGEDYKSESSEEYPIRAEYFSSRSTDICGDALNYVEVEYI